MCLLYSISLSLFVLCPWLNVSLSLPSSQLNLTSFKLNLNSISFLFLIVQPILLSPFSELFLYLQQAPTPVTGQLVTSILVWWPQEFFILSCCDLLSSAPPHSSPHLIPAAIEVQDGIPTIGTILFCFKCFMGNLNIIKSRQNSVLISNTQLQFALFVPHHFHISPQDYFGANPKHITTSVNISIWISKR